MIIWHSPDSNSKSEIYNFSKSVVSEIKKFKVNIKFISQDDYNFDNGLHVYNIGNHYKNHINIWLNMIQCPGVVILHELNVSSIYKEYFKVLNDPNFSQRVIEILHRYSITNDSLYLPLSICNSLSVIVHSEFLKNLVNKILIDKSYYLNLPSNISKPYNNYIYKKVNNEYVNIIIFGYISTNRYVIETIKILINNNFKNNYFLHVVGSISSPEVLNFVKKNPKVVKFHGFLHENELNSLLSQMDFCLNIRNPSVGETSASILRCWSSKLLCVVRDTKAFKELSDKSVIKLPEDNTYYHLINFLSIYSTYDKSHEYMIYNAYNDLSKNHSPKLYANKLLEILFSNNNFSYFISSYETGYYEQ